MRLSFHLNYYRFIKFIILSIFFTHLLSKNILAQENEHVVKIHYLGHSAFVLQFDNGINIVTDFGEPNAWLQWGWDSPIHDIGDLIPDVMTYSHTHHEDHYDPERIPEGVEYILTGDDSLNINGIEITPIRVCESDLNNEDNTAFLFIYHEIKILHLGDAQIQIMNIEENDVKNHMLQILPESLDLLLMTIEGQSKFIPEAELFIDLFQPKRIIPMHYWSGEYKSDFLLYLEDQNNSGKNYQIERINGSDFELNQSEIVTPVKVISLERGPFTNTTEVRYNYSFPIRLKLFQNYPNPFNPNTTIKFVIPVLGKTKLIVYDILGKEVLKLLDAEIPPGEYNVLFNATNIPSGIYYYKLITGHFLGVKKMMVLK